MAFVYKMDHFVAVNENGILEKTKKYFERYQLDSDKVEIKKIYHPRKHSAVESRISLYIIYKGNPFFTVTLHANPTTFFIDDPDEQLILKIFNELYLKARYDELKQAITYLNQLGIEDPFRPKDDKLKFFYTNIGLNAVINRELKEAFHHNKEHVEGLKKYIKNNIDKIKSVNSVIDLRGSKKGMSEEESLILKNRLFQLLPTGTYDVEIGIDDLETGDVEGLYEQLTVE